MYEWYYYYKENMLGHLQGAPIDLGQLNLNGKEKKVVDEYVYTIRMPMEAGEWISYASVDKATNKSESE